jgi:RNA-directed DNA polymerase
VGKSPYASPYVGSLPQGAPSSPALSNLVCRDLDAAMTALALDWGARYSRYADDLCFSFPDSLSVQRGRLYHFKRQVSELLWHFGFQENRRKTQIVPPGARKVVTGLVVNGVAPNVPREIRDMVRQHLYYCGKYGIESHAGHRKFKSSDGFKAYLWGLIRYVESINSAMGARFRQQFELVGG